MRTVTGHTAQVALISGRRQAQRRLVCAVLWSLTLSAVVPVTAWGSATRIGAPSYWPWLLTGLQVLALWSAGSKRWWGWLLGASVQPPWIAYALVTGQVGFIPGCAISAAVQTYSFTRGCGLMPKFTYKEVGP